MKIFYRLLIGLPLLGMLSTANADEVLTRNAPHSSDRRVGVGVSLEGGSGVSLYVDADSNHFVQSAFAWGESGAYNISADYAFGYPGAWGASALTPFWGVGLIVSHADSRWPSRWEERERISTGSGVRIPLGLNFVIPQTPVQLSGELVPTVLLSPASYSYLQGGVAARVLF